MNISLETIDYQLKDSFPGALEGHVNEIFEALNLAKWNKPQAIHSHPAMRKIEQSIFDRFGLNVLFASELIVFVSAAIIPFFKDYQSHSHFQEFYDQLNGFKGVKAVERFKEIIKEREKSVKLINNKTGYINTKLAKMGGYLSEVRHHLIINFKLFKREGFTPQELTAIILHEIGHAFDGMEEHYRLESTNRAIFDILVDLNGNKPDKALYKYKNFFSAKEYQDAQLSSSKDRQDFCGELAVKYTGEVKSQLQNNKYDETNFENMADTFATRFGRGKDLVSGLNKLYKNNNNFVNNTRAIRVTMLSLDVLGMACIFLLVPIYGFILYTVVMAYFLRISSSRLTYDAPIDRMNRIRNTIVNGLKNKNLPPELVKDLLEQIQFIEKMTNASFEYRDLLEDAGNWIFPDARKDSYYIDLQQAIEKQLNNKLFIQAAQLSVTD